MWNGAHKISKPNFIAYLNWMPTYEWRMVRCGYKNKNQDDMFI